MASEHDGTTVTLEVVAPKNQGQKPVGFWRISRSERHTVFLPHSAPQGNNVRVILQGTGNSDRAGNELYDGKPAPEEFTEKWFDNGDGTARRVKIGTGWTFTEREVETIETRKLETKEGLPSTQTHFAVKWGTDLALTKVEQFNVSTYPQNEERVSGGQITWMQTGTRQTQTTPVQYPVTRIGDISQQIALQGLQMLVWDGGWSIRLDVFYMKNAQEEKHSVHSKWADILPWVQALLQKEFPICTCGRQRVEAPTVGYKDHYPKCALCRKKERCQSCGKRGDVIQQDDGRLICFECQEAEKQEAFINEHLSAAQRKELAEFARKLRSGQALEKEVALVVLGATLGHISSDQKRTQLLEKWKGAGLGYYWHYFTPEGVYGTKLAPTALLLIEHLPEASGPGFVEMVAWLTGDAGAVRGDNYYLQTQIQKTELHPQHRMTALQVLLTGSLQVADRLRGPEDQRIAATIGYGELVREFGVDADQVKEVAAILQADAQDYAAALAKIKEAQTLLEAVKRGEVLVNFGGHYRRMGDNDQEDLWVVDSNGKEVEPTNTDYRPRYTSEGDKRWAMVGPDQVALKWSRGQGGRMFIERWEVVKLPADGVNDAQRKAARALEPHERFRGQQVGWDLSQISVVTVIVSRDEQEPPTRTLFADGKETVQQISCEVAGWSEEVLGSDGYQDAQYNGGWSSPYPVAGRAEIRAAEAELAKLDEEYGNASLLAAATVRAYDDALDAADERERANWGSRKVFHPDPQFPAKRDERKPDEIFTVIFNEEVHKGEKRLATEVFYDPPTQQWIKLINDPFQKLQPIPGRQYLVRVRPRNSETVEYFSFTAKNPQSGKILGKGYFAVIIPDPEHFTHVKLRIEKARAALRQKLEQLRSQPPAPKRQKVKRVEVVEPDEYDFGDLGPTTLEAAFLKAMRGEKNG